MSYVEIKAKRDASDRYTGCCFLAGCQLDFELYGFHNVACEDVRKIFDRVTKDFAGLTIHAAIELNTCLCAEFADDSVKSVISFPGIAFLGWLFLMAKLL